MSQFVSGYHHITSIVAGAQEDYDFHVKLLGLRFLKKTVLLDGDTPFYHLYYGNEDGSQNSVLTTMPMRELSQGTQGYGSIRLISLSVPTGSIDSFWRERLEKGGYKTSRSERFGLPRIAFLHPAGIRHELVEVANDKRKPWLGGGIPANAAIRGIHSVSSAAYEEAEMRLFLERGLGFERVQNEGEVSLFALPGAAPGQLLEIQSPAGLRQGSWGFSRGTVHHLALDGGDLENQERAKHHIVGLGYTDVSEPKDRNYFTSIYMRSPAGSLFEIAVSQPLMFGKDEDLSKLGTTLRFPDPLVSWPESLTQKLEPLIT